MKWHPTLNSGGRQVEVWVPTSHTEALQGPPGMPEGCARCGAIATVSPKGRIIVTHDQSVHDRWAEIIREGGGYLAADEGQPSAGSITRPRYANED